MSLKKEEIKGYKVCGFGGNQLYENIVYKKDLDNGDVLFYPNVSKGNKAVVSQKSDSDTLAISEGYISLTPLCLDFVHDEMLEEIVHFDNMKIGE